jgi:hypothetical protein
LNARARIADWQSVKELVTSKKSWFSKAPKSPIGFEPFVEMVADNYGPPDLIIFFLGLVEALDKRYLI